MVSPWSVEETRLINLCQILKELISKSLNVDGCQGYFGLSCCWNDDRQFWLFSMITLILERRTFKRFLSIYTRETSFLEGWKVRLEHKDLPAELHTGACLSPARSGFHKRKKKKVTSKTLRIEEQKTSPSVTLCKAQSVCLTLSFFSSEVGFVFVVVCFVKNNNKK